MMNVKRCQHLTLHGWYAGEVEDEQGDDGPEDADEGEQEVLLFGREVHGLEGLAGRSADSRRSWREPTWAGKMGRARPFSQCWRERREILRRSAASSWVSWELRRADRSWVGKVMGLIGLSFGGWVEREGKG